MNNFIAYSLSVIIILSRTCSALADDSVWLARSCVGEAGWDSHETGECAAILHIYRKRAEAAGVTTVEMAKRYSAAIKLYKGRPNKWVLFLDGIEKPKYWPLCAKWRYAVMPWLRIKFLVALFKQGRLRDPTPDAWHYGGSMDPKPPFTTLIETKFENRFYRRIGKNNETNERPAIK